MGGGVRDEGVLDDGAASDGLMGLASDSRAAAENGEGRCMLGE